MMKDLFLAQPDKVDIEFDLATVNWWIFVVVLAVIYAGLAIKIDWARKALGVMVLVLLGYVAIDQFLLPELGIKITS